MKYNVGITNVNDKTKKIIKSGLINFQDTIDGTKIKAVKNIVRKNTLANDLGSLSFRELPCLLINILSLMHVTLLNIINTLGKTNRAIINNIKLSKISASHTPELTPSQNIRFQKLSLFSLALTKFIIVSIICSIKSSITYFSKTYQVVLKYRTILLAWFLLSIAILSNNVLANIDIDNDPNRVTGLIALISEIENEYNIPKNLLLSIAKVESDVSPLALNKEGMAIVVGSKEEALKFVKKSLAEGIRNIDIGVMQVNYRYHSKNFSEIEDILDPTQNIRYAAKLLCSLYKKHKTWHKAVRYYHSATKVHHEKYSRKILLSWLST